MADKKVKGAGDRFLPGSNIAKHREWRGLKDTWYDYVEWVKVLGIMGGKSYRVRKGDSFSFKPSQQHHLKNTGKTPATVIWVCTPPNF